MADTCHQQWTFLPHSRLCLCCSVSNLCFRLNLVCRLYSSATISFTTHLISFTSNCHHPTQGPPMSRHYSCLHGGRYLEPSLLGTSCSWPQISSTPQSALSWCSRPPTQPSSVFWSPQIFSCPCCPPATSVHSFCALVRCVAWLLWCIFCPLMLL